VTDLHARETELPDWDGPIVELVEEERVVGIVYNDEGSLMAEFYADEDGEPWVFEAADLQRVLDTAAAMLGLGEEPTTIAALHDIHPVDRLAEEFDAAAVHRGEEDEGFYPPATAAAITARCETLDLAVVSLEGFSRDGGDVVPVPGHRLDLAEAHGGEVWLTFQAGCNVQAQAQLERWSTRPGLVVAIEVGDRSGERYVL